MPLPESEAIDVAIMSIVEAYSAMPRGKTISAQSFPEARTALMKLVVEARLDEMKSLRLTPFASLEAKEALDYYTQRRIAELTTLRKENKSDE